MGFILPSPDSPMEQARELMLQKQNIEAEIEVHISTLKANDSTMKSPLVDPDGFPRADVDIYAVRGARVRIIELRNDLEATTDALAKALQTVYDPSRAAANAGASESSASEAPKPFARVDGVAPGSPAADAGLQKDDLVLKFGQLVHTSFTSGSLQPIAEVVAANEDRPVGIRVLRQGKITFLTLTPRKGWGGRGMLGCHVVPYSAP